MRVLTYDSDGEPFEVDVNGPHQHLVVADPGAPRRREAVDRAVDTLVEMGMGRSLAESAVEGGGDFRRAMLRPRGPRVGFVDGVATTYDPVPTPTRKGWDEG